MRCARGLPPLLTAGLRSHRAAALLRCSCRTRDGGNAIRLDECPQLRVFHEAVEAADRDVDEAGNAVEAAKLEEIEADKPHERRACEPHRADMLAACMHGLGLQRGVVILLRHVIVERLGRSVQQIAPHARYGTFGDDMLVHRIIGPVRMAAIEQANIPIGVAFTVCEPASEEAIASRHRIGRGRRGGRDACAGFAYRGGELGGEPLVGIEAEHPIVTCLAHREILLRAEALPLVRNDPCAAGSRNFYGIIEAARVDDDDLRGERHGRDAVAQLRAGVAGDDTKADGERPGHAPKVRGTGCSARE